MSRPPHARRVARPLRAGRRSPRLPRLLGLAVVLGFLDPAQFFRSWLFAYLFWSGVAVGCLSICLITTSRAGCGAS